MARSEHLDVLKSFSVQITRTVYACIYEIEWSNTYILIYFHLIYKYYYIDMDDMEDEGNGENARDMQKAAALILPHHILTYQITQRKKEKNERAHKYLYTCFWR